ncbi:MAG: oligosaccharide flippase family protein, partial [Candidatus Magasanikbacteria bacterium]|nr:oligosaccharide flippase family protein [Candidatus Magasanikbacteria bacterium]
RPEVYTWGIWRFNDMKDLEKWQIISFISRGTAMALGIIQSFFIVRLLSVSEWGIVQIAISIGAALGIYQHLGLASASTREISAAKDNKEIFKIFVMSAFIRYLVSIPITVGLFLLAHRLAFNTYKVPEIELPLKLYALVLLVQGFQSILNSIISGTKRFKRLFLYQAAIAVVGMALYIPLIYFYRVNGYFYALFAFNIIASIVLAFLAFKPLGLSAFEWPNKKELKHLFKELFTISMAIYVVKIIYTNWEKIGPNLLGLTITPELVGYFGFALLYAKKLMNISDAVTDVSLPVFSDKYVNDRAGFEHTFSKNFNKLYILIIFIGSSAVYWAVEVIRLVVGGGKYDPSFPLILPIVFAFIFYSFVNILKSSIIIPAKLVKEMVISFVALLGGTLAFYFSTYQVLGSLKAMSIGMVVGAFLSFVVLVVVSQLKFKYKFITHDHFLFMIMGLAVSYCWTLENIYIKVSAYAVFCLLFLWGSIVSKFIGMGDLAFLSKRFKHEDIKQTDI